MLTAEKWESSYDSHRYTVLVIGIPKVNQIVAKDKASACQVGLEY